MSVVLEGTRLSEVARCPRMASLRAIGATPGEIDPEWQRYWTRGQLFEQYVYQLYAAEHGAENVRRQVVIRWPLGSGHADLFVEPRRELVEVKSTVSPDGPILEMAIRQVQLYKHFFTPAKRAGVYLVNPSSLRREDFLPVKVTPSVVEELVELVGSVERAVETNGEELPACVCKSPGACRQMGCAFTEQAWEDWEPEPPTLIRDAETMLLVGSLYTLKRDYKRFNAEADERKQGYALVQVQLAERGIEPGGDYQVGPYKLRRIVSAPSESFSLARAKKSRQWGPNEEKRFADYLSTKAGSERWTIDLVGDRETSPGEDFGPDAPWTEADL